MELDKKTGEQPQGGDSKVKDNQPEQTTFSVNGQYMTSEQLLNSYNSLQSEFTKKSQRLSELEKNTTNPELEETKQVLLDMGFTTKDELQELKSFKEKVLSEKEQMEQDKQFNDFASQYNTLNESQKNILKDLKKVYKDEGYDSILKRTGFIDQSLIEKSKGGSVLGANIGLPSKPESPTINNNIVKQYGFKSNTELDQIKSNFNL